MEAHFVVVTLKRSIRENKKSTSSDRKILWEVRLRHDRHIWRVWNWPLQCSALKCNLAEQLTRGRHREEVLVLVRPRGGKNVSKSSPGVTDEKKVKKVTVGPRWAPSCLANSSPKYSNSSPRGEQKSFLFLAWSCKQDKSQNFSSPMSSQALLTLLHLDDIL